MLSQRQGFSKRKEQLFFSTINHSSGDFPYYPITQKTTPFFWLSGTETCLRGSLVLFLFVFLVVHGMNPECARQALSSRTSGNQSAPLCKGFMLCRFPPLPSFLPTMRPANTTRHNPLLLLLQQKVCVLDSQVGEKEPSAGGGGPPRGASDEF